MQRALVAVIIGSRADFNVMRRGLETLRVMGVPYLFEVIAPHRGPERLTDFARTAGEQGIEVLIAAGGGSSVIANHIASYTNLPVIGVPIDASPLRGQDALYSMVQTPPGVPVATVGINNSENAAILAAQILALKYPQFRVVLAHRRMASAQRLDAIQKELRSEYPDLCLPDRTAAVKNSALEDSDTDSGGASSEAITPEPPGETGVRIRPGAVFVDRPSGVGAQDLVSTPIPQEPGTTRREARPVSIQQLLGDKRPPAQASPIDPSQLDTKEESADSEDSEIETPAPLVPPPDEITPRKPVSAAPPPPAEPEERRVETKVFSIHRDEPDVDVLEHAMMVLLEGGVLALPTDTVYGLAADATNKDALDRLFALKGQERQRTLGVLIHHPDMLERLVREIPPALEAVLEACWPGALTVILPKHPGVLTGISPSDRVGIRIPNDKVCLEVISRVGRPVAMRNAAISNSEPMTTAAPVIEHFGGLVDCILDGGDCDAAGIVSTVLSVAGDRFEILREGGISRSTLKDLLGDKLKD